MLSKGKQITLGIFTVIGISVLATLSLGKICFIDTIVFAETRPILLCATYVLYFLVFVLYAVLGKRKNLEYMAKTTLIFGAVVVGVYIIYMLGVEADIKNEFLNKLFYVLAALVSYPLFPVYLIVEPFFGSYELPYTEILGQVMLVAAPIVGGIIYLLTKKPVAMEEADTQDDESQSNIKLDT